jgi:hypothetical protein
VPVVFEALSPETASYEKGWFGASRDDHLRGNVLKSRIGNFLPPPDKGVFRSDFRANSQLFLERVQRILRNGGEGTDRLWAEMDQRPTRAPLHGSPNPKPGPRLDALPKPLSRGPSPAGSKR